MRAFIDPQWLQQRLGEGDLRIIESSIEHATYEEAHIPGAVWVDAHRDLLINGDESAGHVITPGQFAGLMSRLGVTPGTTVVWYGDRHSSYAIRGFWTMEHYRHPGGMFVLEGGRERWQQEGRAMTSDRTRVDVTVYPEPAGWDEENHATWQQVFDAPARGAIVLDVRARDEYDGTNVRAARAGHIPGAVHVEWTNALEGPNALKSPVELRCIYEGVGATPDREIITHCQLGIRAAHTWFVLKHVLGYPRVRNYDGSWAEWGNRDDLPIESDQ
jgi:thiosulfate/3-mercaptopyruvate sulfurtransferase